MPELRGRLQLAVQGALHLPNSNILCPMVFQYFSKHSGLELCGYARVLISGSNSSSWPEVLGALGLVADMAPATETTVKSLASNSL